MDPLNVYIRRREPPIVIAIQTARKPVDASSVCYPSQPGVQLIIISWTGRLLNVTERAVLTALALTQVKADIEPPPILAMDETGAAMAGSPNDTEGWRPVTAATPVDRDLELAVIDGDSVSALVFPCRRSSAGWVKSADKQWLDVRPTHWRPWARS